MDSDEEPEIQSINGVMQTRPSAKRVTSQSSGSKKRTTPQAVSDRNPTLLELKMWISNGRARCAPNPKGKSGVWEKFELVYDKDDKFLRHARCKACQIFYSYELGGATTSPARHECEKKPTNTLIGYLATPVIDTDAKREILDSCVQFVCRDLRSFNAVSQPGLQKLVEASMNVALKYGKQPVDLLMPDPTTVSRNVGALAAAQRAHVGPEIRRNLKDVGGAVSLDLYTEDYTKTPYFGATAHYVVGSQLKDSVFFITEYDMEDKTAANVRAFMLKRLADFGFAADDFEKVVFLSDEGTNVVNAVTAKDMDDEISFDHRSCGGHTLNSTLRNAFHSKLDPVPDDCRPVVEALEKAKSLVTHFIQAGLMVKLDTTLKQECETRWNTRYVMLKSILDQYDAVRNILRDREDQQKSYPGTELLPAPKKLVQEIMDLLKPFYDATNELSASKEPTLQRCVPWYFILKDHLTKSVFENQSVASMAKRAAKFLDKKFLSGDYEKAACFLDPSMKALTMFPTSREVKAVFAMVREMLPASPVVAEDLVPAPAKGVSYCDRFRQQPVSAKDEIAAYLSEPVPLRTVDILAYWEDEKDRFPALSALAKRILAIPATSTPSERLFSLAGFVVDVKRTSLKPEKLDDILFLNSHLNK